MIGNTTGQELVISDTETAASYQNSARDSQPEIMFTVKPDIA